MVSINWIAVGVLSLNIIIYWLITQLRNISTIRGGAISGWFSGIIGLYFLIPDEIILFNFNKTKLILIYVIIAFLSILCVFVSRDNPSTYNIPVVGRLFYYLPRIGILMGVITAILNQIIE